MRVFNDNVLHSPFLYLCEKRSSLRITYSEPCNVHCTLMGKRIHEMNVETTEKKRRKKIKKICELFNACSNEWIKWLFIAPTFTCLLYSGGRSSMCVRVAWNYSISFENFTFLSLFDIITAALLYACDASFNNTSGASLKFWRPKKERRRENTFIFITENSWNLSFGFHFWMLCNHR